MKIKYQVFDTGQISFRKLEFAERKLVCTKAGNVLKMHGKTGKKPQTKQPHRMHCGAM